MNCNKCGKEIDQEEQESIEMQYPNVEGTYCEDCIENIIDNGESGIVFENCERCGTKFDYAEAKNEFTYKCSEKFKVDNADYDDLGEYLCIDCALDKFEETNDASDEDN